MIRILNAEPDNFSPAARAVLEQLGEVTAVALSQEELLHRVGDFEVLIVRLGLQVGEEVFSAAGRLRAVVTATTGLDHIDLEAAKAHDVAVLSLRGETEFLRDIHATAEHTWALLLALMRRLPQANADVLAGNWNRDAFRGYELHGRRLGILGLGRIGEKVARYGLAFGMQVGAYDPFRLNWMNGVKRYASLEAMLRATGVLTVHAPLNGETRGLLGESELGWLPAGAVLINTARGAVVDEAALLSALKEGHLCGAALDVVAAERDLHELRASPLLAYARQHDNLLITPHIGGATYESMASTELFVAKKLAAYLCESA